MTKEKCTCGQTNNNRDCKYHFPLTNNNKVSNKLPNKEEETCPHGAKDGECPVEGCANYEYEWEARERLKAPPFEDSSPSDKTWEEAKELGLECPHGNYIGWCSSCPKGYFDYIKSFLTSATIKAKRETYDNIGKFYRNIEEYENYPDLFNRAQGYNEALDDISLMLKPFINLEELSKQI